MSNQTDKEYFADTTAISNSQLRTFVQYGKYGQRFLTPDDYLAMHVDKAVQFNVTDPVVIGKIVDKYFDGEGEKVWDYFIPVAKRSGKEIQKVINNKLESTGYSSQDDDYDKVLEKITEEVNEDYTEITMAMKITADEMINRGKSFRKFKQFLQTEGTEAQAQLRADIEILDPVSGEIKNISMKGKPDFVNRPMRLIVDLKTTGNMGMIIDELQFKGEPKLTANYIRQLSIYNKMSGGDNDGALALVTATGVKWIFVANQILVDAWAILEKDILELHNFLENPETLDESIFKYDGSLENLYL